MAHMEVSWNRANPSHHPNFRLGFSLRKPSIYGNSESRYLTKRTSLNPRRAKFSTRCDKRSFQPIHESNNHRSFTELQYPRKYWFFMILLLNTLLPGFFLYLENLEPQKFRTWMILRFWVPMCVHESNVFTFCIFVSSQSPKAIARSHDSHVW